MSLLKLLFPTVASIIPLNTYGFVRGLIMMITCHTLNISRMCHSSRQQAVRLTPLIVRLHFITSNNNMIFFYLLVLNSTSVKNVFYHHKPLNLVGREGKQCWGNVKSLTEKERKKFLALLICGFLVVFCVPLKCPEVQLAKINVLCYSLRRLLGNMGVQRALTLPWLTTLTL